MRASAARRRARLGSLVMLIILLQSVRFECQSRGWHFRTVFPDGLTADGVPDPADAAQLAKARGLGYGDDVWRMGAEHDLLHTLLAQRRGWPHCPVLRRVAEVKWPRLDEVVRDGLTAADVEAVVYQFQAYLNRAWTPHSLLNVLGDLHAVERAVRPVLARLYEQAPPDYSCGA